ncbi:MAG: DUF4249 domain-containing protein [Rhodothermia bacterium]|nr:DUF4249 domain-containing protein [Rhodothermia bacterium]
MGGLDYSRNRFGHPVTALMIAIGAMMWSGCDESVNPFIESDRYFSLYGTLDMNADTQWVRVDPIDTTIFSTGMESIDAAVSSTDLNTGDMTVWRDSLFEFNDGSFGHVFYAPLRIQPNHVYRMEVERSDGAQSIAETQVPELPIASVGSVSRVVFSNGAIELTVPVSWSGIESAPAQVETWYRFGTTPRSNFQDLRFAYPTADGSTDPGWQIVARLSSDRDDILEQIIPDNFYFLGMGMRIVVFDNKFSPPGGVFDPDILSQPGSFSNVDNGFGFVGSIGRFDAQWVLDDQTALDLGYRLPKR